MAFGSVKSALASTRSSISSASSVRSYESSQYNDHVISNNASDKRNRAVNPAGMEVDVRHVLNYNDKYVKDGQDYSPRTVTLNSRYSNPSGLPVDSEYINDYSQKWQSEGPEPSHKPAKKNGAYNLSGMEMTQSQIDKYNRKYGRAH